MEDPLETELRQFKELRDQVIREAVLKDPVMHQLKQEAEEKFQAMEDRKEVYHTIFNMTYKLLTKKKLEE